VPGSPAKTIKLPLGKPPSTTSSKPSTPDLTFPAKLKNLFNPFKPKNKFYRFEKIRFSIEKPF
jgi:hypothetical protein